LVRAGKGFYLIPLDQIQRFHLLTDEEVRGEQPVIGNPRRIQLSDWFGVEAVDPRNTVGILLEADKGPVLLMVDEILGKREIVLKGLNPILSR
jgi:chemotaxis protein histidine kinase CheA